MQIDGIHHISTVTENGRSATEFVTGVLGLRMAAKTVNQDAPDMYHLFFTDEDASAGSDLTMFEARGATRGRAGAGMVHRIIFRVADESALDFWAKRLTTYGLANRRIGASLFFEDPEGLGFELVVDDTTDAPLRAKHPQIAEEVALRGFGGVRIFSRELDLSGKVLTDVLGASTLEARGDQGVVDGGFDEQARFELRSDRRGGTVSLDRLPAERPLQGAGTVHHVAFGVRTGEYQQWLPHVEQFGLRTSGLVDRFYFESIYFREPGGVLYELATDGPGFESRNPREEWGVKTILPPWLEPQRAAIEANLQPIPDPREEWALDG
ncbi:MAG: VOC family protein [Patulibacter sp.]|nr:VOC family protein [Patulibacter sp.]